MTDNYCKHDVRISHFRCADCDEERDTAHDAEDMSSRDTTHPYGNPCGFVDAELVLVRERLLAEKARADALAAALRDCIKAMELWARDEDGIHPEAHPFYLAAKKLVAAAAIEAEK